MSGAVEREAARDPGLQAERTALAWTRTALSIFVNALLALRTGWASGEASVTALGVALMLAAASAAACGAWRRHRLLGARGALAPPALAIAGAAWVTLLACGAAIVSVLATR
jgi:uncharacterized membrane protein YidH (DUF202 family)